MGEVIGEVGEMVEDMILSDEPVVQMNDVDMEGTPYSQIRPRIQLPSYVEPLSNNEDGLVTFKAVISTKQPHVCIIRIMCF